MQQVDLAPGEIKQIVDFASLFPEIEQVIVFGSRALGNAKPGSDVDLALLGPKITAEIVAKIKDYLEEETLLPYFFDIVHFETIGNEALKQHIREHGKALSVAQS